MKAIILLATLISLSFGCLITNCPRGGKRGGSTVSSKSVIRECPSCGPDNLGQCFGPHICCGPNIGCFIGTPETYGCKRESLISRPCIAGYAMCRENSARCATDGICCTQESCHVDSACDIANVISSNRRIDSQMSGYSFVENNASPEQNQ